MKSLGTHNTAQPIGQFNFVGLLNQSPIESVKMSEIATIPRKVSGNALVHVCECYGKYKQLDN